MITFMVICYQFFFFLNESIFVNLIKICIIIEMLMEENGFNFCNLINILFICREGKIEIICCEKYILMEARRYITNIYLYIFQYIIQFFFHFFNLLP